MIGDMIDCITSLCELMELESDTLATTGRMTGMAEIAAAKGRLVGRLETELARLARQSPDWLDRLANDERARLTDAVTHLRDASLVNAHVLERQIEFSVELMAAIASEAQRLTGKRSSIYDAAGDIARIELPAPISINARL